MGVPLPEMEPVENASAEALLSSLKTIDPGERRKHASVFNYWLTIRGSRQFPPIRDLDPLEISDAGPWSLLLEMIGGGEDAIIRHFGQAVRGGLEAEKIGDAPSPSLLSCIHSKLPIVAACREAFAFEERFEAEGGPRRCWVTLLPFSENGTWIDYVYGYVSLDEPAAVTDATAVEEEPEAAECEMPDVAFADEAPEAVAEEAEVETAAEGFEPFEVPLAPLDEEPGKDAPEAVAEPEPEEAVEAAFEPDPETDEFAEPEAAAITETESESEPETEHGQHKPGFTKFLESIASVGNFYGKVAQSGPELPPESFVEEADAEPAYAESVEPEPEPEFEPEFEQAAEPTPEPASIVEGTLQSKLSDVRALAEEAREAQVRSNIALYEGLSAAYDFALDAEDQPDEYLRLVEAQGLKIQLRSPMKPVVKLAFDGMCDEPTIKQLEAVLAWALKHDLPKGTLATRIQEEGGIGEILNGKAAA